MIRELVARISGYPGLFFACVGSGFVVPFPEDIVLFYAGLAIGTGSLAWGPTLVVACLGVLLRDVIAWTVGRLVGDWLLHRAWVSRLIGRRKLERARHMVEERQSSAILLGRFLVGMRAPVFLVAGASGVSLRRFVLLDGLGILVAVPAAVLLGHWFGQPLIDAAFAVLQSSRLLAAVGLVVGAFFLWRWRGRLQDEREDTADQAA